MSSSSAPSLFLIPTMVSNCNRLLCAAGLADVACATSDDVVSVISTTSALLASLEALVGRKLKNAHRKPNTEEHRKHNVKLVLDELQTSILQTDLAHINAARIVNGDERDIKDVLEIMAALANVMPNAVDKPKTQPQHIKAVTEPTPAFDPPTTTTTTTRATAAAKATKPNKTKTSSANSENVPPRQNEQLPPPPPPTRRRKKSAPKTTASALQQPFRVGKAPHVPLSARADLSRKPTKLPSSSSTSLTAVKAAARPKSAPPATSVSSASSAAYAPLHEPASSKVPQRSYALMASLKKLGTGKPKASVASRQASEARRRYAKASEPLAAALAAEAPGIAMRDAAFKASRPAPVAISKPAPKTRASLASDADGGGVLKAVAHKVVDGAADPEFRASLDRKLQNEMSRLEQVRTRARITRAAAGLAPVAPADAVPVHATAEVRAAASEMRKRDELRRELVAKEKRVESRVQSQRAEKRKALAQRGARRDAKIEMLKGLRFEESLAQQERSRAAMRASQESTLFRQVFLDAVNEEVRTCLDDAAEVSKRARSLRKAQVEALQHAEGAMGERVREAREALARASRERALAERESELHLRDVEATAKLELKRERDSILRHVAAEEEASYHRALDPERLRPELQTRVTKLLVGGAAK